MKNRSKKILKRLGLIFFVITALFLLALHWIDFGMSDEEISRYFAEAGVSYTEHQNQTIYWVETGDPQKPAVIFIHGSPGDWENYIEYLSDTDLLARFHLISVSRPGYKGPQSGTPVPSLARQAEAVASILPANKKAILVGHSLGAPIAVKFSLEYPEKTKSLVLLSAAMDPDLEKVMRVQQLADFSVFAWMLPQDFRVCNRELIPLEQELRAMKPFLGSSNVPLTALHGDQDQLVPVENVNYMQTELPSALLDVRLLEGANHFIPWTHFQEVRQAVLDQLSL